MKLFKIIITIALFILGLYLAILSPIIAIIDLIDNWSILSTAGKAWDMILIVGREFLAGIVFLMGWLMIIYILKDED